MVMDQTDSFRLNLVSANEKKEFLSLYMSYRMELLSKMGDHLKGIEKEDHLSKFWNDTNNNYLLWFVKEHNKIGFAAISLKEHGTAELEDMSIFRDHRGKGHDREAIQEIEKFVSYRGLKKLMTRLPAGPEHSKDFYKDNGFKEVDDRLELDLDLLTRD